MDGVIELGANEIVEERPFTHPRHTLADLSTLRYMADRLCLVLKYPEMYAHLPHPLSLAHPAPHRLVISQPERLNIAASITVVGFFGQKRENADPHLITEFDGILVNEIPEHPDLLSYSSLQLSSGNYGNLVLFACSEGKLLWSRSRAHAQAVNKLSPYYYRSIRIYNGLLPNGVHDSHSLRLTQAKYFDYQSSPMWRAVRHILT